MEPAAQEPPRLDLHLPYGPLTPPSVRRIRPLRIKKKSDSGSTRRSSGDDRSARTCSRETEGSRGSAARPPGGEQQQLTIPKVRGSRGSRVFGGLDDVDESPVPLGREPYIPKDVADFRDRCFMSPRHVMSPPYRPFPGLLGDIIQRSRTSNYLVHSDPSGPLNLPRDEHEDISILVPEVRVTPDTKAVDHGYHNFWAAIEVEGIGGRGTMYDVIVNVEATAHSCVLEVIRNYSAPSTLAPGSGSLLVLANVELPGSGGRYYNSSAAAAAAAAAAALRGHVRSQSDELMDDLESQLGSAVCEYLRVNLIYRHTAFPSAGPAGGPNNGTTIYNIDTIIGTGTGGVTGPQTKIRTTFTASIARRDASSPWSPPPAPAPSRIADLVAAHWGVDAADEILATRLLGRGGGGAATATAPRRTTYLGCLGGGSVRGDDVDVDGDIENGRIMMSPSRGDYRSRRGFRGAYPGDENVRHYRDDDGEVVLGGGIGGGGGSGNGSGCGGSIGYRGGMGSSSKTSLADMTNQQQQHHQHQHQHQHQQVAAGGETLDRKRAIRKASGKSRRGSGRWGFGNWWA